MAMTMPELPEFPLQMPGKRVAWGIALALAVQAAGIVWGASALNSRVTAIEEYLHDAPAYRERVIQTETRVNAIGPQLDRIENKVDRLEDRQH